MKRHSNLVIAFVLIIASTFFAYAMSRIFLRVFITPDLEIEQDFES